MKYQVVSGSASQGGRSGPAPRGSNCRPVGVRRRSGRYPARYAEWGGPIGKRRSFWWFAGAWTAFMATCAVVGLERGGW